MRGIVLALAVIAALTLIGAGISAKLDAVAIQDIATLKSQAERHYAEGSFAEALRLYQRADALTLSEVDRRWVDFRLADCQWRSLGADRRPDQTPIEESESKLKAIVEKIKEPKDRDLVWALAAESLGDLDLQHRRGGSAWNWYSQALSYWADQTELETARKKYIEIVFRYARGPQDSGGPWGWSRFGYERVPSQFLENALSIAKTENDRAGLAHLLAMALFNRNDFSGAKRAEQAFLLSIQHGKRVKWYDEALYHYGLWSEQRGATTRDENGNQSRKSDFEKALKLYQRLISEYKQEESAYWENARDRSRQITQEQATVMIGEQFLPGSLVRFHVAYRNVAQGQFAIYRVNVMTDFEPVGDRYRNADLYRAERIMARQPIRTWQKTFAQTGKHYPGQEQYVLEDKLPVGAYLISVKAGSAASHALLVVTDAAIISNPLNQDMSVYMADAISGQPVPNAKVKIWFGEYNGQSNRWNWVSREGTSNSDGMVRIPKPGTYQRSVVIADADGRTAFIPDQYIYDYGQRGRGWMIYAFTDRPAYRPGDTVQWKSILRAYQEQTYATPAGKRLELSITDPKGEKVKTGLISLNDFGSCWGDLELTDKMPLGQYMLHFSDPSNANNHIGSAVLFRLEEYKLPEFKVSVSTLEENGVKKTFRLGEPIEIEIKAEFYFGGAVGDADVDVVVRQRNFYPYFAPDRRYPWYFEETRYGRWGYNWDRGQEIRREKLKTDGDGRARLTIESPPSGDNIEYIVEARVTDSSRREIVSTGTVRVTNQRYFAHLDAKRFLVRPGDRALFALKTKDANKNPVSASGKATVYHIQTVETWINPHGVRVSGAELETARSKGFPMVDGRRWQMESRAERRTKVKEMPVNTTSNGEAEFDLVIEKTGAYEVVWLGPESDGPDVKAQTNFWVADRNTRDVERFRNGLEIVVESESMKAGGYGRIALISDSPNSSVLLTLVGQGVIDHRLVRMSGRMAVVDMPIDSRHVPNFYVYASTVRNAMWLTDQKEVIVPPEQQFLNVEVVADREVYEPGETGSLTITAKDHAGKPVITELGVRVSDYAVEYIQKDETLDPRQFFYGDKRYSYFSYACSLAYHGLSLLEKNKDGSVLARSRDELAAMPARENARFQGAPASAETGGSGGFGGRGGGFALGAELKSMDLAAAMPLVEQAPEQEIAVRTDFRATAYWNAAIVTDANGKATVQFKYPESTTEWRAVVRGVTTSTQVGKGEATSRTRKPIIVRLQAPRFFVVGDEPVISAVVNNNTDQAMRARVSLDAEGIDRTGSRDIELTVPANGEARADWKTRVLNHGPVKLKTTAVAGRQTDGMERTYLAFEHGIDRLIAKSGKFASNEAAILMDIPAARRSTEFEVMVTPSLAVTMLDALPYLIRYPYGCTEQTMSRFLPTVIVKSTLQKMGMKPEDIANKVFGGITPEAAKRMATNPQAMLKELDQVIQAGLARLYDMQHEDGGWGWWKEGESDLWMTAYVVWGLTLAQSADLDFEHDRLERGRAFLQTKIVTAKNNLALQTWVLHALTARNGNGSGPERAAFENLYERRSELPSYSLALLALSAHRMGMREQAQVLSRNLANGAQIDNAPDQSILVPGGERNPLAGRTAFWGSRGYWWRWHDGPVESTSFVLSALLAIDPKHELIEPAINWLLKNRRGAQWSNTRDTAIAILTLNDYLKTTNELGQRFDFEVFLNGRSIGKQSVTPETAISAPSRFAADPELVRDGRNEIRIVRTGESGNLYFSVEARFFSLEEPIPAGGHEIFARREFYRYVEKRTLLNGIQYERVPLRDGETVRSGERVEVVVTVESKNDYEYLIFEDLKPAGLEAVQLQSGAPLYARELKASRAGEASGNRDPNAPYTGRSAWLYQELRDRKVAMFASSLEQGLWEIRYELRAEVPGRFHALPLMGHAMYVPEIRCNSDETRLTVLDR
ncbi:MAG: alpha-2-macroglobulin [Armatimonadetes bacterium]|nr:alpha-2-macroglobulin [Armatimonadota bacterium]